MTWHQNMSANSAAEITQTDVILFLLNSNQYPNSINLLSNQIKFNYELLVFN